FDRHVQPIPALDAADARVFDVAVAGPAALLISKLHKISERIVENRQNRLDDKDALDILRLLQAVPTAEFVTTFRQLLQERLAATVTTEAITALENLFGEARRQGAVMAARAAGPLAAQNQIAQSCAILASDLLSAIAGQ